MGLILNIIASSIWPCQSIDTTSDFLQNNNIGRDVYVEANIDCGNKLWKSMV